MQYLHLVHASSSYLIVRDQVGLVRHADSAQCIHFSGNNWLRILTSQSCSSHPALHQPRCWSSDIEVVVGDIVEAGVGEIVVDEVVSRNVVVSGFSNVGVVAAIVVDAASVVVNAVVTRDGVIVGVEVVLRNVVVSGFSGAKVVAAMEVDVASVVVNDVVVGRAAVVDTGVLRNLVVSGFSGADVVAAMVVNETFTLVAFVVVVVAVVVVVVVVVVVGTHHSWPL